MRVVLPKLSTSKGGHHGPTFPPLCTMSPVNFGPEPVATRKRKTVAAGTVSDQFGLFPNVELPELYKKAVSTVHIAPKEGPMTLQQYRVFDALLKNATDQYKVDPKRVWYTISVGDLADKIGLESSNNVSYVKRVINDLVTFGVNWDYLAGLNKGEWNSSALLAGAKMSRGVLSYHYAENLRELFMNPEIWAWVDFRIMKRFSYAVTPSVYQNVLRYQGLGKTPALSVDVWRDMTVGMEWRKGSYKDYKEFKRRVILKALNDINEQSDHTFELIEVKEGGRAVTALQFLIKEKVVQEVIEEADLEVLSAVKKLGLPLSEARKLIAQHGAEVVMKAVRYTEHRQTLKLAPVANVAAYLRMAIKGKWSLDEPPAEEQRALGATTLAVAPTTEEVTTLFRAHRLGESQSYFLELDPSDQAALIERYNDQQDFAPQKIESIAKMKKSAASAFFIWLANDTWGEPTDRDLLNFLMTKAKLHL